MKKVLRVIILICYFCSSSLAEGKKPSLNYPTLSEITNFKFHGNVLYVARIKVLNISRIPIKNQSLIEQYKSHLIAFYHFEANIKIVELYRDAILDKFKIGKNDVKIVFSDYPSGWKTVCDLSKISIKSTKKLNSFRKSEEYIVYLGNNTSGYQYRTGYQITLYSGHYCNNKGLKQCNPFYVYPMRVTGNIVEIPIEFYNRKGEILTREFKLDDVVKSILTAESYFSVPVK